jgi:hypothetical protein
MGAQWREGMCPACGRFVGTEPVCPYCDLDQPEDTGRRVLRLAAWCLTLGGLAVTASLVCRCAPQPVALPDIRLCGAGSVWQHPALHLACRHVHWIAWCLVIYVPLVSWIGGVGRGTGRGSRRRRIAVALSALAWYIACGWAALVLVYGSVVCCAPACATGMGLALLFALYPIPLHYALVGVLLPLACMPGTWGALLTDWLGLTGGAP